jgi:hypothetical protein
MKPITHNTSRRLAAAAAALTLAAGGVVATGTSAAAEDNDLIVCTGAVTVDYSPALGPLPKLTEQTVTEELGTDGGGSCTGPFAGGTAVTTFEQQVGCLLQGLGDTLVDNVVTYHWQGGQSSTITYSVTTVAHAVGQLIVTSTGTVTDGYGEGALSERIAVYPDLDVLSCLTSHVDQQTGTITVAII